MVCFPVDLHRQCHPRPASIVAVFHHGTVRFSLVYYVVLSANRDPSPAFWLLGTTLCWRAVPIRGTWLDERAGRGGKGGPPGREVRTQRLSSASTCPRGCRSSSSSSSNSNGRYLARQTLPTVRRGGGQTRDRQYRPAKVGPSSSSQLSWEVAARIGCPMLPV